MSTDIGKGTEPWDWADSAAAFAITGVPFRSEATLRHTIRSIAAALRQAHADGKAGLEGDAKRVEGAVLDAFRKFREAENG